MFRTLALFSLIAADIALAQTGLPQDSSTVLPRILVIIDSSKSMTESPDGLTLTPVGAPGGDYDCTAATNPACTSKLCSAKQILCETMTSVSSNNRLSSSAAVGLATYYQYVLYLMKQDSRGALCRYDILEAPGKTRSVVSETDLTGTSITNCQRSPPYTCTGDSKTFDMYGRTSNAPWAGHCNSSAGSAVPTATTYTVTKVSAEPRGNTAIYSSCILQNYGDTRDYVTNPGAHFPKTFTRAEAVDMPICGGYTLFSGAVAPTSQEYRYRRSLSDNCSPALPGTDLVANYTGGIPDSLSPPAFITTAKPELRANQCQDTQTSQPINCYISATYPSIEISASYPLHLFLKEPPVVGGQFSLFVFYNPTIYSANGALIPPGSTMVGTNRFDTATNYSSPDTGTEHVWTVGNVTGTCELGAPGNKHVFTTPNDTYRITSGNLFEMGLDNAPNLVWNISPKKPTTTIDVSPAFYLLSNTYSCTPDWPCDITFKGMINPNFSGVGVYTNAPDPSCTATSCTSGSVSQATCRAGPVESFTGPMYATLASSGGACASSFTSDMNSVVTPQTRVNGQQVFSNATPWPTDCGPGKDSCTFRAQSATGVNSNSTCPIVVRYDTTAALSAADAEAACPAYKLNFGSPKTYNAPSITSQAIIRGTGANCPSTTTVNNSAEAADFTTDTGTPLAGVAGITFPLRLTNGTRTNSVLYEYFEDDSPRPNTSFTGNILSSACGGVPTSATTTQYNCVQTVDVDNPDPFKNTNVTLNCADFTGGVTPTGGDIGAWNAGTLANYRGKKRFEGKVYTGVNSCGSEGTAPCYTCRFTPLIYEFLKAVHTCTYSAQRAVYVPSQERLCFYQRDRYPLQRCTGACQYGVTASRYDWSAGSYKVCKYTAHPVRLTTQNFRYTYNWQTKGGEIFGRADFHTLGKGSWCTDPNVTWGGTDPESQNLKNTCPDVRDCLPGTGTRCKLVQTWNMGVSGRLALMNRFASYSWMPSPAGSSRYDWYGYNSATYLLNQPDPNNPGQIECPSGLPEDQGGGYATAAPAGSSLTKTTWCNATGTPEQHRFRLIADWYDNTGPGNSLTAVLNSSVSNSGVIWEEAAWSKGTANTSVNQARNMGFSGPTPDGGPPASQIFVPIPDDGFDENQQNLRLMSSLRKCAPFTNQTGIDAGGLVTVNGLTANWDSRGSGVCIADEAEPTAPGWNSRLDFTPLYGSLASAKDYINRIIDSDNDYLCRNYYVVLATDGLENTPRRYTDSELVALMGDYRNNRTPGGRTKAIKPFIVSFGNSFTGGTNVLDNMQVAADVGLGRAFSAADPDQLRTALTTIFSSITSGVYSRSKPTLSTDGERLYAGYYSRGVGTPEWLGELYAFAVDSISGYSLMWGHSLKLNDPTVTTDANRNILAAFGPDSSTVVPFRAPSSSAGLNAALTSTPRSGGGQPITADQIINFVRNPDFRQRFPAASPPLYRKSRLGPIIRSAPVVVGASPYDPSWGGVATAGTGTSAAQQQFVLFSRQTESRKPIVLVGTGDGMLRAVRDGYGKASPGSDGGSPYCTPGGRYNYVGLVNNHITSFDQAADGGATGGADSAYDDGHPSCPNGTEAWAFVPPEALPALGDLLVPRGAPDGVDGLTSVADVCSNPSGSCNVSDWKTIAIGSMRGTGRSLFALDITGGERTPTYLWSFTHYLLGSTTSSPVIGRVNNRGRDTFVGIFGGGRPTAGGSWSISPLGSGTPVVAYQGRAIFVIDAMTGAPVMGEQQPRGTTYYPFVSYFNGNSPTRVAFRDAIEPRPGSYRQPNNPYLFAVYVPMKSSEVIAMRFSTPDGGTLSDPIKWAPSVFWTPYDTQVMFDGGTSATGGSAPDASTPVADAGSLVPGWTDAGTSDAGAPPPAGPTGADITQVAIADAGTATTVPTYKLVSPSTIPTQDPEFAQWGADGFPIDGSSRPKAIKPILNRPRAVGISDGTGQTPDVFIMTGDENATAATNPNYKFNYIVALHDPGENPSSGLAGQFMWAHYFLDPREQVVSEPAFTPNCMVVATYLPPAVISGASSCAPIGKTTLYAFNARTGALSDCLNYTGNVAGWSGQQTSVLDMGNVGIPSDLITINGKIFFNASNAGLLNVTYKTPTTKFGIRSFRRIR